MRKINSTENSTETVKHLMSLFGLESVPQDKFDQAVFVIAGKWQDGCEHGMALQKKKPSLFKSIRKILRLQGSDVQRFKVQSSIPKL